MSRKPKLSKVLKTFSQPVFYTGFLFLVILITLTLVIWRTETKTNSQINSIFDAFWYTLVTITTVGYGDITPLSVPGRVAGIILLIFGVAFFAAISGKIASTLFNYERRREKGLLMLKKIKNHFIICGWKPDFENILLGILKANPDLLPEMIVVLNNAGEKCTNELTRNDKFKGIKYVNGDFSDEAALIQAHIKDASRVLILADESNSYSPLEIDSRTVLAVITIENLTPDIYVAAELLNSKFEKHLKLAHCDEIILANDYERNLVVSASNATGISHVLRELITEQTEKGLVIEAIPQEFIGEPYNELYEYYREKGNVVLTDILENTGNFHNRRREALAEAQKNPDMKTIVSNLQRLKSLQSNNPVLAPNDSYIILPHSKAVVIYSNLEPHESEVESE